MTQEDKLRSLAKSGDGLNAIEKSDLTPKAKLGAVNPRQFQLVG